MSEGIVGELQFIEVNHDQAGGRAVALDPSRFGVRNGLPAPAVVQAREVIDRTLALGALRTTTQSVCVMGGLECEADHGGGMRHEGKAGGHLLGIGVPPKANQGAEALAGALVRSPEQR